MEGIFVWHFCYSIYPDFLKEHFVLLNNYYKLLKIFKR